MDFWLSAFWSRGPGEKNEDSVLAQEVSTSRGKVVLMAVADGIGGLDEGETASGYICEKLTAVFYDRVLPSINRGAGFKEIKRMILRTLYETTEDFKEYSAVKGISLGSTLSCILIVGRRYMTFQSGDSKIIRFRRGSKLLTSVDVNSDGSINKCLGSFDYESPRVKCGFLFRNTGILVCSDGFWKRAESMDMLKPREIKEYEQVEKRLAAMASHLRKKGERDNISAVYAKCL